MRSGGDRWCCQGCGTRLARDNCSRLCSPCSRREVQASGRRRCDADEQGEQLRFLGHDLHGPPTWRHPCALRSLWRIPRYVGADVGQFWVGCGARIWMVVDSGRATGSKCRRWTSLRSWLMRAWQ
jgi:hypothetical protein